MSHVGASRSIANGTRLPSTVEFVRDAQHPTREDDEEDIELPEFIVGDDDAEGEEGSDQFNEDLPKLREDGGDPLDDANASDLDIGVNIDEDETREASADASEEAVDVGALDDEFASLDDDASALDEDREPEGFVEDDESISFDDESSADDGGTEGTGEDAADAIDENALPELDESENDQQDDSLADVLLEEATRAHLPSWAASRFVPLDGAGAPVPCVAVSVFGGRVYAAGDVLLTVDEGAHAARRVGMDAPSSAIAGMEGLIAIATVRDGLLVSRDGCVSASAVTGFSSTKGAVGLACTPGRLWLLQERALWSLSGGDTALVRVRESGVWAMGVADGSLVALTNGPEGVAIEKLRGDDEAWSATVLPDEVVKFVLAEQRPALVATAGGKRLAIASQHGLYMSNDGGSSFVRIDMPGAAAACFAGEDEGADLLVVIAPPGEPVAHLIRVTDDGEASRLAEVRNGNDGSSFGEVSIAWDSTRELLWIASRHGLLAWGPTRRH